MTDHARQPEIVNSMFDLLPPAGSTWDPFDRQRWMAALDAVLELVYPRAQRHDGEEDPAVPDVRRRPRGRPSTAVKVDVDDETGTFTVQRTLIPCPHCELKFKSRQALSSHLRSHRFQCDVCTLRFGSERELGNHRARAHPEAESLGNGRIPPTVDPEPEDVEPETPAAAASGPHIGQVHVQVPANPERPQNPLDRSLWQPPARPVAEPLRTIPVADQDAARARAAAAI